MATGALDANGIWQYGEDDSEPTFSALLNKLGDSVSDKFTGGLPVSSGGTGATTVSAARDTLGVGVAHVVPSGVTFVGGTGTVNAQGHISWTNCTKVQIAGVFSANYTHYRVIMNAASGGTNNLVRARMMNGTSTEAATAAYVLQGISQEGDLAPAKYNTTSALTELPLGNNHERYTLDMTIFSPNVAVATQFTFQSMGFISTPAHRLNIGGGRHDVNSEYTGFSIFNTVGSNSGNIQIFGFNI